MSQATRSILLSKDESQLRLTLILLHSSNNDQNCTLIFSHFNITAMFKLLLDGKPANSIIRYGDYYLCFLETWSNSKECYGAPLLWNGGNDQGTRVRVVAGQTTTNVDLLWGPDLIYYLPLITR